MTICGSSARAWRRAAVLMGVVAAMATLAPTALAGSGPKTTPCAGALGPVVVPGTLEVLPGTSCTLAGTQVLGSVLVDPTATLQTSAKASIAKDLECGGSSCTLTDTSVGHDVDATRGSQLQLTSTTVGHDLTCDTVACTLDGSTVTGRADVTRTSNGVLTSNASRLGSLDCDSGVCYLNLDQQTGIQPSVVDGNVGIGLDAYLLAGGAQIGGSLSCSICSGIEIYDSSIGRNVSVVASSGSLLCNSTIGGNVSVSMNRVYFATCAGNTIAGNLQLMRNRDQLNVMGNVVGQNVQLVGNTAVTDFSDNHVRNTVTCVQNTPPPIGAGNTAKKLGGQCAALGVEA